MQKHDIIECAVESLGYGGKGVARVEGRVIFIERGLPGQTVKAEITKVKSRFAEARIKEVVTQSPDFTEPFCRHFGECGGCAHQDLAYAAQVREKTAQVVDAMARLGKAEFDEVVESIASPEQTLYRNKMEFAFTGRPQDLALGLRRRGAKDVVNISTCRLQSELTAQIVNETRVFCKETEIPAWNPRNRKGVWRHLVVRHSKTSDAHLVHLITGIDSRGFDAAKSLGEFLVQGLGVDGFVHSTRKSGAELAFGERRQFSVGNDFIGETLNVGGQEFRYKLPPNGFFQPNTRAAEQLFETAVEFAGLTGTETVADLYCGAGGLSLPLAAKAGKVVGLELSEEAVRAAERNAQSNGLKNCSFTALDLEHEAGAMAGACAGADVVVFDPPRGGLSEEVCEAVKALDASRLVALSCDPPALARDVARLGYHPAKLRVVDQFPHTPHVECVALLVKK